MFIMIRYGLPETAVSMATKHFLQSHGIGRDRSPLDYGTDRGKFSEGLATRPVEKPILGQEFDDILTRPKRK